LIPNLPGIISEEFANVPSEYETSQQIGPMMQEEIWSKINEIRKKVEQGEITTEEQLKSETDRAFEEGQEILSRHYANYDNAMKYRAQIACNLSRLSPTALFQFAAESLAETGLAQQENFEKDVKAYAAIYDNYILNKLGKLVATSLWSFGTSIMLNGQNVYVGSPRPEEYQGDKSDFPRFMESQSSVLRSLSAALFDLSGLIIWNLVLAFAVFGVFNRSDVR
jgi:hypothetical protein